MPVSLAPSAVLLDLDGTITDSAPAITVSIAEALAAHGYRVPDAAGLLQFVGPPIHEGFSRLGGVRAEDLDAVVETYRARYTDRMLDVAVYPGVRGLVTDLVRTGVPVAVATSKVRGLAVRILDHAGLTPLFTAVCGATPDESRSAKADIVTDALAALRAARADVAEAVMVGDRHHDVQGAAANGVRSVLVRWGYATPGEEAGATAVARDADELRALLGLTGGSAAVDERAASRATPAPSRLARVR